MKKKYPITIVHEVPGRVRVRCELLKKKQLDPEYLEAVVSAVPGVESARVNSHATCIAVAYDGRKECREAVMSCLSDVPKEVLSGNGEPKELQSILQLITRGVATLSLLFLPPIIAGPLTLALTTPVVVEGVIALWKRGVKVEVLDGAAVLFCLFRRDYFTASSIVMLLAAGEYIEEMSEQRSTGLLKSLLKPQVENIWIEVDGRELEIPLDKAQIGDHVVCGVGEMIPLDGKVLSGEASVNTSSISGESVPIHVAPGDDVLSGAVIEEGRVVFEASHVGAETSMARISSFLENSLKYQSESEKKSDELADKLVPITFGLGLGLLAITRDLQKAAAVLTVDYSCAIKLVNPVAVRVAMYTAARQGVLLKGSQAMDNFAHIDTLVFDKTGTLTKGELQVTDIHTVTPYSEEELLALAASAEEHYSHPVADAVVSAACSRKIKLAPTSEVDFIVAHGVSAYIEGKNVMVGSRHFIEDDEGVDCSALKSKVEELQQDGKSILYVAYDEELAGVIGLRDELRAEANTVLKGLKNSGIKNIIILTGDAHLTAQALAAELDSVDQVHSELKPEDKARVVGELKEAGHRVGFIGDGVNDAPALVSADLGISLPNGADLAKESAQVILLQDDLRCLLVGRLNALHNQKTIKQSFNAVVGLNSAFLMLASFGLIMPVTAALLHNISTVSIVGYASARSRKIFLEDELSGDDDKEN